MMQGKDNTAYDLEKYPLAVGGFQPAHRGEDGQYYLLPGLPIEPDTPDTPQVLSDDIADAMLVRLMTQRAQRRRTCWQRVATFVWELYGVGCLGLNAACAWAERVLAVQDVPRTRQCAPPDRLPRVPRIVVWFVIAAIAVLVFRNLPHVRDWGCWR